SDRVSGLEAGADDFLTKPVDDVQLMARVKSLVRLKSLTDELRARVLTGQELALEDAMRVMNAINSDDGQILLVDTDPRSAERVRGYLCEAHRVDVLTSPSEAALAVSGGDYELALVSMSLGDVDPLRVCSQMRTVEQSRTLPIILIAEQADRPRVVRG